MKKALTIEILEDQGFENTERIWQNKEVAVLDSYIFNICKFGNEKQFNLQFLSFKLDNIYPTELNTIKTIVEDLNSKEVNEALIESIYERICSQDYQNEILQLKDKFDSIDQISNEFNLKICILKSNDEQEIISNEKHYNPLVVHLYLKANKYHILCKQQVSISSPIAPTLIEINQEKIQKLIENFEFVERIKPNKLQDLIARLKLLNFRYNLGFNLKFLEKKQLMLSVVLDDNEIIIPLTQNEGHSFIGKDLSELSDQSYELPTLLSQQKFSDSFNRLEL